MPDPTHEFDGFFEDVAPLNKMALQENNLTLVALAENSLRDLQDFEGYVQTFMHAADDEEYARAVVANLQARAALIAILAAVEAYNTALAKLGISMHPMTQTPEAILHALTVQHDVW